MGAGKEPVMGDGGEPAFAHVNKVEKKSFIFLKSDLNLILLFWTLACD